MRRTSMWSIAVSASLLAGLAGCAAKKSSVAGDPFTGAPSLASIGDDRGEPPEAGNPNDRVRPKSTSPVSDRLGLSKDRDAERGLLREPADQERLDAALGKRAGGDPFLQSSAKEPSVNRTGIETAPTQFVSSQASDGVTPEEIRRRLDKLGATNLRLEKDPATGKSRFRCEVPYLDRPGMVQVFEPSEPVDDEVKAMLAVTLAAEKWAAERAAAAPIPTSVVPADPLPAKKSGPKSPLPLPLDGLGR